MKIDKRIAAELDGIKKLAAFLPNGKANALLNKCAKIGAYARKGQALITLGILWLVSYLAQNHEQDEHINQLNINENGN